MSKKQMIAAGVALLQATLLLSACAPGDPVEQIAKTRARYSARLNGFYVQAQPLVEDVADVEVAVGEEPEAAVDEEEMVEAVPVRQKALLDIIVQHDSATKLGGITLDITMVGTGGEEKGRWLHWVETGKLEKANQMQFTYEIEDVPYVEGDGFSVEVRHPVPIEERGEYREFSSVG